jgi:hypothetical protein
MLTKDAGKALASALARNSVLTELDVSSQPSSRVMSGDSWDDGPGFAQELAVGISDNGVLTSLDIDDNDMPADLYQQIVQKVGCNKLMPLLVDTILTQLSVIDVSGIGFRSEGAVAVATYISDNRALSSVNLLKNTIGVAQAKNLVSILKEHPTLKSLCGNKDNETELDMSNKMSGAGDAIMLVAEIVDNGALSTLIFGGGTYSNASTDWELVTPAPATLAVGMTEADFSNKNLGPGGAIIISAWISHKITLLSHIIMGPCPVCVCK